MVAAKPYSVVAWWFDPDRLDEFKQTYVELAVGEVLVTQTTVAGVRIREAHFTDQHGWSNQLRIETTLEPDGLPSREGDRFVADANETAFCQHPLGESVKITCTGRIQFGPRANGETAIRVVHNHVLTGGTWQRRRALRDQTQGETNRAFLQNIAKCSAAVANQAG